MNNLLVKNIIIESLENNKEDIDHQIKDLIGHIEYLLYECPYSPKQYLVEGELDQIIKKLDSLPEKLSKIIESLELLKDGSMRIVPKEILDKFYIA